MLSYDQSLITLSISMREVIITSILYFLGFGQKKNIQEEWSRFKFKNVTLALGMALKFFTAVWEKS